MNQKLRVLIVEDSEDDALLVVQELKRGGYNPSFIRVDTGDAMRAALDAQEWDVIIADYSMPSFSPIAAIGLLREYGLDLPFIIVSGTIGEETAVAAMKAGAHDYLMKGNLKRLVPAVEREIRDAKTRIEGREANEKIRHSAQEWRSTFNSITDMISIQDSSFKIHRINDAYANALKKHPDELVGQTCYEVLHGRSSPLPTCPHAKTMQTGLSHTTEYFEPRVGRYLEVRTSPILDTEQGLLYSVHVARDITDRKESEEELNRSYATLKKTLSDAINTMAKIVEMRDPYTSGHQQRVTELAVAIANEIGFDEVQIENLTMSAIIHDIGKIHVPSDILNKPGKLTALEFNLIKNHPQGGYDIVNSMDFPHSIAWTILQHHERIDGSGYPKGLKDGEISIDGKILAVADVVEAMATHRPYRPALGIDKALEEISSNRGILYDSEVVDSCLKIFKKDNFAFKTNPNF